NSAASLDLSQILMFQMAFILAGLGLPGTDNLAVAGLDGQRPDPRLHAVADHFSQKTAGGNSQDANPAWVGVEEAGAIFPGPAKGIFYVRQQVGQLGFGR